MYIQVLMYIQKFYLLKAPFLLKGIQESRLRINFSGPQKYESFSSLTPCYLLKVTKFLVKIPQFEFLVMKNQHFCKLKTPFLMGL